MHAPIAGKMKRYEWRDSTFVIYAALDGPVEYKAGPEAGAAAHVHLTPPSLDPVARASVECRGGELPATPLIVSWNEYADYLIDRITADYMPELKSKLLRREAHSPLDLERKLSSAVHGTIYHGAMLPYQTGSMRPIPEMGEYRSPVANVYLCGSGSHPEPGVSMAPGRNAAETICSGLDLGFRTTASAKT